MPNLQLEMTEAVKINHLHSHLGKEALQTFENVNACKQNEHLKMYFYSDESASDHNPKPHQNANGTNSVLIQTRNHYQIFLK